MTSTPPVLSPQESLRLDLASPLGFQPGYGDFPGFMLWNLRKPLGKHPAGSTITQESLDRLIAQLHPVTTPAQKVAEYAELRSHLEAP